MTASKEPMCKLTSIERLCCLKFMCSEIKIKCDDELTGKNSVIPCTKERINISIIIKELVVKDVFLMSF